MAPRRFRMLISETLRLTSLKALDLRMREDDTPSNVSEIDLQKKKT
mgnify:CR=1 FL=1